MGSRRHLSLGLQRVVGVRVVRSGQGQVGEALGILRRRPVVQRISLTTAAALVANGAPLALRTPEARDGSEAAPEAAARLAGR